jgi:hypothetical protein
MSNSNLSEEERSLHRRLAVDCFNETWRLMDLPARTAQEADRMLYAAFASCYHWSEIGAPINQARGEWQVSRVYTVLGQAQAALRHAHRCLQICQDHQIGDWDLAFAYEALARAAAIAGEAAETQHWLAEAVQAARNIAEEDDRQLLMKDLATIPGYLELKQE